MLEMNQKRRDQFSIMVDIIDCAREGMLKTKIMHKANLCFAQMNEYLANMMDNGLIRQTNLEGREGYIATDYGKRFAEKYHELLSMLTTKTQNKSLLVAELFQ